MLWGPTQDSVAAHDDVALRSSADASTASPPPEITQQAAAAEQAMVDVAHPVPAELPPAQIDFHATQDGASASRHSLHGDAAEQVPPQPTASTEQEPATAATGSSITHETQTLQTDETEKGKEKVTLTIETSRGKRRREAREVSDGVHTASSTTERPSTPRSGRTSSKRPKTSVLARLVRVCTSCIHPSGRDHDIDLGEGVTRPRLSEKQPAKDGEVQQGRGSSDSGTGMCSALPSRVLLTSCSTTICTNDSLTCTLGRN